MVSSSVIPGHNYRVLPSWAGTSLGAQPHGKAPVAEGIGKDRIVYHAEVLKSPAQVRCQQQGTAAGDEHHIQPRRSIPKLRGLADHLIGHRLQDGVDHAAKVHGTAKVFDAALDDGVDDLVVPQLQPVGLTWAFCRFLDRSSLRELGLQGSGWLSRLAAGWSLGTLLQFLVFLVLLLAGWLTVSRAPWQPLEFAVSVLAWIVISFNEELAFRGYILQRLMPGVGVPAAVILSSLVFAAVHVNPNVQVLACLLYTSPSPRDS